MPGLPRLHYRRIGQILLFVFAFILASYLAHEYKEQLSFLLEAGGSISAILFVLLTAFFVVFVIPLDLVFLVPIGAHVWGPVPTALMSILGWVIGAAVAFFIAREYGLPIVTYILGEKRVKHLSERIPQTDLFWSVVFLRMLIPVDLLSYALGLFTRMPWGNYLLATAIGVSPFGFFFAYAGTLPPWYQAGALLGAFALVSIVLFQYRKKLTRDSEPVSDDDQNRSGLV